jgi:hypothetical protein
MADPDRKLKELFGPSDRGVDRAFVNMVDQHVLLERRLRQARRLAWRKFGKDVIASGIVLGVLLALVSLAKSGDAGELGPAMSPTTLVLFIFGVWAAAALKPAHTGL